MRRREAPGPFVVRVGGEEFTFACPDGDFGPGDLRKVLRAMLGGQYEAFVRHKVPEWKMHALVEAGRIHYSPRSGGREGRRGG